MTTTATLTLARWNGRRTETVTISLHRTIGGYWAVVENGRAGFATEEWAPQFEVYRDTVMRYREQGWR